MAFGKEWPWVRPRLNSCCRKCKGYSTSSAESLKTQCLSVRHCFASFDVWHPQETHTPKLGAQQKVWKWRSWETNALGAIRKHHLLILPVSSLMGLYYLLSKYKSLSLPFCLRLCLASPHPRPEDLAAVKPIEHLSSLSNSTVTASNPMDLRKPFNKDTREVLHAWSGVSAILLKHVH